MEEKILLAYQFWSKEFDWYTPNGHPEDWIIDGKKELPFSHGEMYFKIPSNFFVSNFSYENISNLKPARNELLMYKSNFESKLLNEIPENQKYILPIFIHKIDYFYTQSQIGFKYLLPRVINDVKKGIAKIVLYFPFEGNISISIGNIGEHRNNGLLILDKWCNDQGFTKDQVFFINGNLMSTDFNLFVKNFTAVGVDAFIDWIPRNILLESNVNFNPTDQKHLFLSYNRAIRMHRKIFLLNLLKENLFDRGLISCGSAINPRYTESELIYHKARELIPYVSKLNELTPITLDLNLMENNPAVQITRLHYESTFISVITETHFEKDILFRSEKIFKPIAVGHPFIVISCRHFLKKLKLLGFRTFEKWINESYDDEEDIVKRIKMIVTEIKKFSLLDISELKKIRSEMKLNLYHNQTLLRYYQIKESKNQGFVNTEFKKIWNSIKN